MAHTPQARKRVRQNVRRAERNAPFRTRATHAVRDARTAIEDGADDAAELVRVAQSSLDRAARRNIIHKNSASRTKARLSKALKAAASD
jgi:small subunit ribosomal protein S20